MTFDADSIRVSIHPEPTDEEFLAILQALKVLDNEPEAVDGERGETKSSGWRAMYRQEQQRLRHWPWQEQSWARRR